jgi:hypothetical protein
MAFGNNDLIPGHTYFARELATDVWETCTIRDIANPDYKPFLAVPSREGYAVWDVEKGIPVYCSDRGIFKQFEASPEDAIVSEENILFNSNGHKGGGMAGSLIFQHFNPGFLKGIVQPAKKIETEEFIEEFGDDLTQEPDLNL